MKELTVAEHKKIALEILVRVAEFCDKNDLTYYLTDGTLLGSIRHNGFIPWDDDIDIMMPRDDYEKFLKIFNNEGSLMLASPYTRHPLYYYAKVYDSDTIKIEPINYRKQNYLGVDIDIFPIDGQPDRNCEKDFLRDYKKRKQVFRWLELSRAERNNISFKRYIASGLAGMIGTRFFVRLYNKIAKKYKYNSSEMVGCITVTDGLRSRHQKNEVFYDKIRVSFEGYDFWAPAGYDVFLTDKYGDYMQLPPESERITHHINKVYRKGE